MSDSEREPREPSPFIPDEADAPRDPETGAIKIDEPDVGGSTAEEDADVQDAAVDEASEDSFPASDPPSYAGGSGTAGPASEEEAQAGSYARDAEQDPSRERHDRSDTDR
jgi:hypothetical protein